ncbi:MAG: hypothetical protein AAF203_10385, partial [Pseudomonadota bacterium]
MGVIKKQESVKKAPHGRQQDHELRFSKSSVDLPHLESDSVELDVIEKLKSNILMLDDLQQRLGFMNDELESVL